MKKIAIITPILPFPVNSGSRIRIFNIVKTLKDEGFELFLLYFDPDASLDYTIALKPFFKDIRGLDKNRVNCFGPLAKQIGNKLCGVPFPPRPFVEKEVNRAIDDWKPDFIQLEKTISAAYLNRRFLHNRKCRILLEEGGVHHLSYYRQANIQPTPLGKVIFRLRARRLQTFESKLLKKIDAVVAVSDEESELLRKMDSKIEIICAQNGIDRNLIEKAVAAQGERETAIFFCGDLNYLPNRDAVEFYLRRVHPLLTKRGIKINFIVAGGNISDPLLKEIEASVNCQYLGYVDDIYELFRKYSIFINPMRLGGGTRLKMIEAMGSGMACVSTTIGAEGIQIEDGVHFLLANEPRQMADKITILASKPDIACKLGINASKMVASHLTWQHCLQPIVDYYKRIACI